MIQNCRNIPDIKMQIMYKLKHYIDSEPKLRVDAVFYDTAVSSSRSKEMR